MGEAGKMLMMSGSTRSFSVSSSSKMPIGSGASGGGRRNQDGGVGGGQ